MATWAKVTGAAAAAAAILVVAWWATDAPASTAAPERAANAIVATADVPKPETLQAERDAVAATQQRQTPAAPPAAAPAAPAETPGLVRGRAVDAATGEPLAGVRVSLPRGNAPGEPASDLVVQTGVDGVFEHAVRGGSTPMLTLARDDVVETRWGFLRIPPGHTEQIGDVALRRGRFVRGRAVVADGGPLPANTLITIEFVSQYDARRRERFPCEARPDASGVFTTQSPLPFLPTIWKASSDELRLEPPVQVTIGEAEPSEVVLVLQRRETIGGIVVDEAGAPVPNIGLADHPTPFATKASGADGRFVLPRLRPGDGPMATVYLAQTPGCEPLPPIANVAWGTTGLRIVVKRTRPFALEVVDANGAPVERFGIGLHRSGLMPLAGSKERHRGTHTGGRLAVDDVVRGATTLRVMPSDPMFTPSEPFEAGAVEPLRVVLQRRVPLDVLVHDGGDSVPGVAVELLRERGGASASVQNVVKKGDDVWMYGGALEVLAEGRTDAAGRVTLLRDADPAGCVVCARLENGRPGVVRVLVAPPAGEPLRIELLRSGTIGGRVELRGRPRDAVRVVIPSLWSVAERSIEVGADGAFAVKDVQAGSHRVQLQLQVGGRLATVDTAEREVQVPPGGAASVAFDLADVAVASVRGTVVAAAPLPKGLVVDFRRHAGGPSSLRASAEVSADGTFAVAEILPGTYHVAFRLAGTNALVPGLLPEPLVIAAGEQARPRLQYTPRRLVVNLRRPDGSVVRGERVTARCGGATWPEIAFLTPAVDERIVLEPAPLVPLELRGWSTPDAWSAPVVMPPDRAELEVTVILPAAR